MSHAYARNYIHLVFATKERKKKIKPEMQAKLYEYLTAVAEEYGVKVLEIGGAEDHVHMLLMLSPAVALAPVVRALKGNSSKWMNETGHFFGWQKGYGAFSVSASNLNAVQAYVRGQAEHHRTRNYEEEFLALLRKHGVAFTPEHVFG